MNATEHMNLTGEFAIYPDVGEKNDKEVMYLALGLVDEAGEVAGKIKKLYRDGQIDTESVAMELGDVYWYLHRMCAVFGFSPENIMAMNYNKLKGRSERGTLGGSGDVR